MQPATTLSILKQGEVYLFQLESPDEREAPSIAAVSHSLNLKAQRDLQSAVQMATRTLIHLLQRGSQTARARAPSEPDPLEALGKLMYSHLVPPPIQEALRQLHSHTPLIVSTNDTEFPWEMLHDDVEYLALKHPLGRRLISGRRARRNVVQPRPSWSSLLVANPTGDLDETDEELQTLMRLIEAVPGTQRPVILARRRATKEALLRALAGGEHDLIHYSGHAVFDETTPEATGLLLAGGEVLTAGEIERVLRGRPLVFLNACQSARGGAGEDVAAPGLAYAGLTAQGLAAGFVLGGARGFIGTLWPVYDVSSREFTTLFYRLALAGETIGEALRGARERIKQQRPADPIWASFVLYGDPCRQVARLEKREHRPATVLFARLLGLEELYAGLHLEEAAELADVCLSLLIGQIACYGGEVRGMAHDTLVAAFGLTEVYEDDAERAIRAALGMRETLVQRGEPRGPILNTVAGWPGDFPLEVAVGLSSGDVVAGGVLTGEHKAPVMGKAVNEAAWLARQARGGQILAGERVHRGSRHLFDFTPLTLTRDPGPPVQAYEVLRPRPEGLPKGVPASQIEMIGREREIGILQECWQLASRGQGQIVGIVGDPGIGKSRLLVEFRQTLGDAGPHPRPETWLVAGCSSYQRDVAYGLLGRLLRGLLGITAFDDEATVWRKVREAVESLAGPEVLQRAERMAEMLAALGPVLGLDVPQPAVEEPKARQGRLVRILRGLLVQAAAEASLILALEDMHWADEASVEVIDRLVDGLSRLPVLTLVLFRPEWMPPWANRRHYRQINLDQLGDGEQRQMLEQLLEAGDLSEELIQGVLSRTGGNPFFIEETVRSLKESQAIVRDDGGWRLARPPSETLVPDTVRRTVLSRMDRLAERERRVLQVAAVAGREFAYPVLAAVLGEAEEPGALEASLEELDRREFIIQRWPARGYAITHALVQETAYDSLPGEQKRLYHRRVGEALEQLDPGRVGEDLALLAHHFYHGVTAPTGTPRSPQRWGGRGAVVVEGLEVPLLEKAVKYLILAGARARQGYANREAVAHYQRALDVVAGLPQDAERWRAQCFEGLGEAYNWLGEFDMAVESLERAFTLLTQEAVSSGERRRVADIARQVGRILAWGARYDEALEWMERGLSQLGEKLDDESRGTAALITIHTGVICYYRGQYDEAAAYFQRGLGMVEGTEQLAPIAEAYNLLGAVDDARGRRDRALEHYRQSLSIWEQLGSTYQMARVEDNVGVVYFHLGRWEEAAGSHGRALAFFEQIEDRDQIPYCCLNLGNVHLCRGEWDLAGEYFERAQALCARVGNRRMVALSHMNLGLVYLAREDWAGAREHLEQSLDTLEAHGISDFLPEACYAMARLCLGEGDAGKALEWGQRSLEAAQELEMQLEEGLAHRVLGTAHRERGDLVQAEEHLRESLAILESIEHRYEVARTLVELALVLRDAGEEADAQADLQRAVTIFEELGARADLERGNRLVRA